MHKTSFRIYFEDTDGGAVIFHANYIKFADRARAEWLRERGIVQSQLAEKEGIYLAVYHQEIDYLKPAGLDDVITIETELITTNKASAEFMQIFYCQSQKIASVKTSVACVNREIKSIRFPKHIEEIFQLDGK